METQSRISRLVSEFGEEQAKTLLLNHYRKPENIAEFSLLFSDHVPTDPAAFHLELYQEYGQMMGFMGAAAPRGFSKSTITDVIFLAWVALFVKRHFVILISDTHTQATMLLEALKEELENNEALRWLFGDVKGEEWTNQDLIVRGISEDGYRTDMKIMAKGAGMKIRGLKFRSHRPGLVLIDDLENDELVESPDRRRKLKNWLLKSVLPALAKDIGCVIMIGTILHRDSLLNNIISGKDQFAGWKRRKYKAILDDGNSLWPERFLVEDLKGMRDDPNNPHYIGPIAFSQEMQNEPVNEEDQIIKPEWIDKRFKLAELLGQYRIKNPEVEQDELLKSWLKANFSLIIGSVDPAISEKTTADYWAMATIGIAKACPICDGNPAGHILQLDMVRMREGDPLKQVGVVMDQYAEWKHDKVKIEAVAYQQGLFRLSQRIGAERNLYPPLHAYRPDRDKVRRAIIASASFAGGLVHVREDHPLAGVFIEEMLSFPQGVNDDMFDALLAAMEEVTMKRRTRVFTNKPSGF